MSSPTTMSVNPAPLPAPPAGNAPDATSGARAIVSRGLLGPSCEYNTADDHKKLGGGLATSLILHGGLFLVLVLWFAGVPQQLLPAAEPIQYNIVHLPEPGRGGGGGGSPAPAPKKAVEIPKHAPPAVAPVEVPKPVDPPPITLVAPIETNTAALIQSSGQSLVSLASYGGGGRGGGIGSGTGNGVGPGTGGGFGDGAYAPGNGVSQPTVLKEVKPTYTPDAMRTKLQGMVTLEITVLENGRVGDVRVVKSLDRASGIDAAAMDAAKKWLFKPGEKDGKPVVTRVFLELEFRLH